MYDTRDDVFGTASVSALHDPALLPKNAGCGLFPFNVANPMVTVSSPSPSVSSSSSPSLSSSAGQVVVVGGEINTRKIGQTMYRHDSQMALVGMMTVL